MGRLTWCSRKTGKKNSTEKDERGNNERVTDGEAREKRIAGISRQDRFHHIEGFIEKKRKPQKDHARCY
jgi:hypothetical protein